MNKSKNGIGKVFQNSAKWLVVLFIRFFINPFLRFNIFFKIFNIFYENSPQILVNIFHSYVKFPPGNYFWSVKLKNDKIVKTKIYSGNYKTLQFAIDYKWYAPGMSIIENEINEYYNNDFAFIDIGANLGMRSLIPLSTSRSVFMFEPNIHTNKLNQERCLLNNFSNYHLLPYAVSSYTGKKTFYYDSSSYLSSFNRENVLKTFEREETVDVVDVDSFFGSEKYLYKGYFMKIDTEGHEIKVIEGGKEFIKKYLPTMVIEINDKNENFKNAFSFFNSLSYRAFGLLSSYSSGKLLVLISDPIRDAGKINATDDYIFINDRGLEKALSKFMM